MRTRLLVLGLPELLPHQDAPAAVAVMMSCCGGLAAAYADRCLVKDAILLDGRVVTGAAACGAPGKDDDDDVAGICCVAFIPGAA
jgi:hypothetical protein